MSNLIKAYNINYSEEKKKLDMNKRADEIEKKYIEQYYNETIKQEKLDFESLSDSVNKGEKIKQNDFRPGIQSATVIINDEETETAEDTTANIVEEYHEEIEALENRIRELSEELSQMRRDAELEAEQIKQDAVTQAENEKKKIIEQAKEQGFSEGQRLGQKEADKTIAALDEERHEIKERYEKQVRELEPAFVKIVIRCIDKLTGILSESRSDIIEYLIHQAMLGRENSNSYIIRVSSEDYSYVAEMKDNIKEQLPEKANIEIIEDKLISKNQCMIETDSRVFDCSLDMQVKELIENLRFMAEVNLE